MIFISFPSETHEAVTKVFQMAFDKAMSEQAESSQGLNWESGGNKYIQILDQKSEEIIATLCGDYTLYRLPNDPLVVVEVAFSQTPQQIEAKFDTWVKHKSIVAVIIVHVVEQPRYQSSSHSIGPIPKLSDWDDKVVEGPLGPIKLRGKIFAGAHTVTIEIREHHEQVQLCRRVQEVRKVSVY
jgi:hypothetical protein